MEFEEGTDIKTGSFLGGIETNLDNEVGRN